MSTNFFTAAFSNLKTSVDVCNGVISVGIHTEDEREVFYLSFSPVQASMLAEFLKCKCYSISEPFKAQTLTKK